MTDQPYQRHQPHQPYEGHEGYDAQVWSGQHQQGHRGYDDPDTGPHTQQWQGQTWETQLQPPVPAEETAYLPPQGDGAYGGGYGEQTYGSQPYQPQPQQHQAQYQPQAQPYQPQPQAYAPQAQAQAQAQAQPQPQPYAPEPSPAAAAPAAPAPSASPAATASADAPEYGPATLAGNARITDAQRARAEGRSPIIDPRMQPAALTALLGLLLAGAAEVGTYALLVPLVVLQAVTAAGWFRLNGMWPARQGIALGFAGALAADAAMLVSDRSPAALLGTLGVWVLLSLVLQLRSHADPDERMYGLMATVVAAALAVVAGGYLAADADAATVGAVAVAVAVVARALPMPTPASVVVALLAAAGTGTAVGAMTGIGTPGALIGAGAAVCALIGHRVAAYDYPSRFVHFTAGVALPLAASAPAVYALGRVFG
ncbi:hypothetical protein [Streptomyces sp. JHA26]|uniref:hypothetical protein n=1 Tax=Streptomyces sp. JHA26 TaxID=1917143 RepID=UPI00098B5C69|nr:hypothetical protein [Streptomyces sp. JHA26]